MYDPWWIDFYIQYKINFQLLISNLVICRQQIVIDPSSPNSSCQSLSITEFNPFVFNTVHSEGELTISNLFSVSCAFCFVDPSLLPFLCSVVLYTLEAECPIPKGISYLQTLLWASLIWKSEVVWTLKLLGHHISDLGIMFQT